jgi:type II secretory pathway predicted ATPase ExeA
VSGAAYLAHFGLAAAPFAKEIGDTDLWLPPSKVEIVDGLVEAADERANGLLVGEPGAGKTCVLRALHRGSRGRATD